MLVHPASLQGVGAMGWIKEMPSDLLRSVSRHFSRQLKLIRFEPVFAEGTICSYCLDVIGTLKAILRSLPARHLYAASIV
jgi:hypothetical protein